MPKVREWRRYVRSLSRVDGDVKFAAVSRSFRVDGKLRNLESEELSEPRLSLNFVYSFEVEVSKSQYS